MSVSFIYQNGLLNMVVCGKVVQIDKSHPGFAQIKKALQENATEQDIEKLLDVKESLKSYVETSSKGRAVVKDGQVFFDGKLVHNTISKRILELMREGLPFQPLLLFMENIAKNPSYRSVCELYDFLEHKNMPITSDGHFLGYKAVRGDFRDKYTGTIDNSIGKVVTMERAKVDDERANECSAGLHVGALDYASNYGGTGDRMLIVKVNPADAVSVPKDYSYQKLRVCRYEVIGEFERDLTRPLYNERGEDTYDDYEDDDDWDDLDDGYEDEICYDCEDCPETDCPDHPDYVDEDENDVVNEVYLAQFAKKVARDRYGRFASAKVNKNGNVKQTLSKKPKRDSKGRFSR